MEQQRDQLPRREPQQQQSGQHEQQHRVPADLLQRAIDKLNILDAATSLETLRVPPSNLLEALGLFFRMDPQFWINLQSRHDMRRVEFGKAREIRSRVRPLPAS